MQQYQLFSKFTMRISREPPTLPISTTHSFSLLLASLPPCFQLPTKNRPTAASLPNPQLLSHHPVTTLHRISPSPQKQSSDASNSASRPMGSQASRTLPLSPANGHPPCQSTPTFCSSPTFLPPQPLAIPCKGPTGSRPNPRQVGRSSFPHQVVVYISCCTITPSTYLLLGYTKSKSSPQKER